MSNARLIGTLISALVILLLASALVAQGQQETTISGRVVNGTAGAVAPPGIQVSLVVFPKDGQPQERHGTTDDTGKFVFPGVPLEGIASYNLVAEYLDVSYSVNLSPEEDLSNASLKVYEATSSLDLVGIEANTLIVLGVDPAKRALSLMEIVQVANQGDRTFRPDRSQIGPMDLLRFPLPPGAENLEVQAELPQGEVLQVDRGFALTTPVPPGVHGIAFSYTVPYAGSTLDLSRSFSRGAGAFRLLVSRSVGDVSSHTMADRGEIPIGGTNFRILELSNVSSGTAVDVTLKGLPQPSLAQRMQSTFALLPWTMAAPAALAVALTALLLAGLRRREGPVALAADSTKGDRASLVNAIAALDDRLQRGEIEEPAYLEQRRALKAYLLRLAWHGESEAQ